MIQASLAAKDEESVKLVQTYVDKILAVAPGDADALKYKEIIRGQGRQTEGSRQ